MEHNVKIISKILQIIIYRIDCALKIKLIVFNIIIIGIIIL